MLVLEAAARPGGVIATRREEGFVFEEGPDCFISNKPWAIQLCRELGVEDALVGTRPENRRSFILRGNQLLPIPQGFYLLAPTSLRPLLATPAISWRGKLRMAMELFMPRRSETGDETLEQFVTRRLGREALERLAQPMVAGIYNADPGRLSLEATFPQFLQWEKEHGSILRALWRERKAHRETAESSGPRYGLFLSFPQGVQTLTEALASRLPPGSIRLNTRVTGLARSPAGRWRIDVDQGQGLDADALCLAVPAPKAAQILRQVSAELSDALSEIPYLGSVTVNVALRRDQVGHPLDGMGFVVPAVENRSLLACTFSSIKFAERAPDRHVLLRAFLGGPSNQDMLHQPDPEIEQVVMDELRTWLKITGDPLQLLVHRHPESMPQYLLGHRERVAEIESLVRGIPGLVLAGNAYHGVGIPDCIRSAEAAASDLVRLIREGKASVPFRNRS